MASLTLDLGCGDYDIVRPLKDGAVRAEGLKINFVTINKPPEVHWRMGVHHEFDAAEMSFGSFVAGKAYGNFPLSAYRLSCTANSAIRAPTSMSTPVSINRKISKAGGSECQSGK